MKQEIDGLRAGLHHPPREAGAVATERARIRKPAPAAVVGETCVLFRGLGADGGEGNGETGQHQQKRPDAESPGDGSNDWHGKTGF